MRIEKSHFGNTPPGHPVIRFSLRNDRGITVNIINLGAAVQSFFVPDQDGNYDDIVLGYNNVAAYWFDTHYMGATIGRYANRIADGRFTLNGIAYALSRNHSGHHLHGGTIGFDKKIWDSEVTAYTDRATLTLRRLSEHEEEAYPGNLRVAVIYSLNNDNELCINYRADTDRPTPVNLSHHSYFNLSGDHNATIGRHTVWINADHFLPVNSESIPTGVISPVSGTPLDFRKPTAINNRIDDTDPQLLRVGGYDHNWVLNDYDEMIKLQASVYEPDSGRNLEVYTSEPGLQFYSGNSLHSRFDGKSGRPYRRRQGLCLEPQHFPDSPNHPGFPSTILHPGKIYQSKTIYRLKLNS